VDTDALIDFLDQLEQLRDEQEADTPPALAEDVQSAVLALLDAEIDLVNDVISAKEDGDDVGAVVDEYDPQMEEVFSTYFEAYTVASESCPNLLDM
jgi:hypothetical protein